MKPPCLQIFEQHCTTISKKDKSTMPLLKGPMINEFASPFISEREIDQTRALKVIYIGAGVSEIIGAIEFRKLLPTVDLVIYEKNPELGDTWYENRYPGCACGKSAPGTTVHHLLEW